jgi:hypothetical protein
VGGREVEGVELRGCETRLWALLGLRLMRLSFGLSFFFYFIYLFFLFCFTRKSFMNLLHGVL